MRDIIQHARGISAATPGGLVGARSANIDGGCPARMLGAITGIHRRDVECGGLPPLFAARACPGVLHAFSDAEDRARRASPEYSGSKLPHST